MCVRVTLTVQLKTPCKRPRALLYSADLIQRKQKTGFFFSFFFLIFPFSTSPFIRTDTFSHSIPEIPTVTKTKTPLHSFNFTRDGGLQRLGGGVQKHQQPSESREAPLSLQRGEDIRITHVLTYCGIKKSIQADRALKEYK